MQHAALNRATMRVAETTGVSGRLTAGATIQAQGVSTQISDLQAQLAELQSQVQALQSQLAALQSNDATQLNPYVSVDPNPINGLNGPNIIFTGANIHIRSGSGATDDNGNRSGLGNLIIGYDEEPPSPSNPLKPGDRGGSNNLVIGRYHRFTSAAFGGLVAGEANMISAEGASVSGGLANAAIGAHASVSGGFANTASGDNASVSGGVTNTASGQNASVSGGLGNTAAGWFTVVIGGQNNTDNKANSIAPQPPFP